jgi:hypothetical protein
VGFHGAGFAIEFLSFRSGATQFHMGLISSELDRITIEFGCDARISMHLSRRFRLGSRITRGDRRDASSR